MKKLLGAFLTVVLLATFVVADSYIIPKDNNEQYPSDINLAGVTSKYSTTYTTVCVTDTPSLVYGVVINSKLAADATGFVVIYDTANAVGAGTSSAVAATVATNFLPYRVTTDLVQGIALANRTQILFDPPIICNNGIFVYCPGTTGATSAMQWSIQYRHRIKGN